MSSRPRYSVIVPAFEASRYLSETLPALRKCAIPEGGMELIVVDDGSSDPTGEVAAGYADRVLRSGQSQGASQARNTGATAATGAWLVFVDADVRVHPDMLTVLTACVERHPDAAAVFGAYDAAPAAPGKVSQYRNLLHRYTHLAGAGNAETFWSGLGAVRRDIFASMGGFDPGRWQLEDIELGYRLRARGWTIVLDPSMQGTHLKRWSLPAVVLTDFRDRALPWMRLLLEGPGRNRSASLNIVAAERLKVGTAGLALGALIGAGGLGDPRVAGAAMALVLLLILSNWPFYRWLVRQGRTDLLPAALPLHLWYYFSSALAAGVALVTHLGHRSAAALLGSAARSRSSMTGPLWFAPLHKRAFGMATGLAAAALVFLATLIYLARDPRPGFDLGLLGQFFAGYSVSLKGAFIGAAWAGFAGFVLGWFLAFSRNFVLALLLLIVRSRAELSQTRGFLDHI